MFSWMQGMVESKPTVVVFGATGAQGGSVARALLRSGRYAVRGVTRDPEGARAQALAQEGAQLVQADQRDAEALEKAMEGAYGAYVVTDFYSVGPGEFECGAGTVEAAKRAGVQHLLWSTLPNVEEQSGGKYHVPHFTLKAKVDDVVRAQNFKHHTFIVCAFYFQNFEKFSVAKQEEDNSVSFHLPMEAGHMLTGFDVDDTGAAALAALENPAAWDDKYINLAGFHAPVQKYIEIFEKVTGRKAALKTVPEAPKEEWTQMYRWFSEFTYYGNYDITNGRRANPNLKDWEEWLSASNWVGPV